MRATFLEASFAASLMLLWSSAAADDVVDPLKNIDRPATEMAEPDPLKPGSSKGEPSKSGRGQPCASEKKEAGKKPAKREKSD